MDAIQENNLFTSSDYEHIIEDLQSDNAFQLVNQGFPNVQKNNDPMITMQSQTNPPPILENYTHIQTRGKIIDREMHVHGDHPPLENYMVQEFRENLDPLEPMQSSTPLEVSPPSLSPTCTIPCRDNYLGPLNFELLLDSASCHRRSWVFSNELNKVFIDINKSLLVQFRVKDYINGLSVRALPVYSMDDYVSTPVQRCDLHIISDDILQKSHSTDPPMCFCANFRWVRHVVRSNHAQAIYEYDCDSDRHSVRVPLEIPQAGCDTVEVEYHFSCKTSCPKGMSRKPINVIFTLETEQSEVLGRFVLPVKICSCPKRDKEKEEADSHNGNNKGPFGPGKRRISSTSEKQEESKKIKIENTTPHKDQLQVPSPIQEADNNNQNQIKMTGVRFEESEGQDLKNITSQMSDLKTLVTHKQEEIIATQQQLQNQLLELKTEVRQQQEEIKNVVISLSNRIDPMLRAIYQVLRQGQV